MLAWILALFISPTYPDAIPSCYEVFFPHSNLFLNFNSLKSYHSFGTSDIVPTMAVSLQGQQ
jgi:hypothetical protein